MPVRIDRSEPLGSIPRGTYLLEVSDCAQKTSKKNESMLKVTFRVVGGQCHGEEVEDYFMLEGKGRGMGQQKLEVIGIDWRTDFEAYDLVRRRAYGAIIQETRDYQGKTYTNRRINAKADGSTFGLWSEDAPPAGVDASESAAIDDEGPF